MISRVFSGITSEQEHRGKTVQQGGVKALISLAAQNTEKGADLAAQSVAKIAITMNPEVAFPGQRVRTNIHPKPQYHYRIIACLNYRILTSSSVISLWK